MRFSTFIATAVLGFLIALPAFAADKDKEKTPEEKEAELRNEAATSIGEGGALSLNGKFTVMKDDDGTGAAKPFPKVIGTFETADTSYTVIAPTESMLKQLIAQEKKSITVLAKVLDKQDQGMFAIVAEIASPPAPPNPGHKKRGSRL